MELGERIKWEGMGENGGHDTRLLAPVGWRITGVWKEWAAKSGGGGQRAGCLKLRLWNEGCAAVGNDKFNGATSVWVAQVGCEPRAREKSSRYWESRIWKDPLCEWWNYKKLTGILVERWRDSEPTCWCLQGRRGVTQRCVGEWRRVMGAWSDLWVAEELERGPATCSGEGCESKKAAQVREPEAQPRARLLSG